MAADLGKAYVQIVASAQGISGSITGAIAPEAAAAGAAAGAAINKNVGTSLSQTGKSIGGFSKAIMPLSLATGAVFGASVAGANNFSDSMAKMSTLVDTGQVSIGDLSQQFLDLSNQTGVSATELADAGYQALSAGQSVEQVGGFVETASNLSKAGFTSTTTAVDVLTTAMNAYGENAGTADEIANKLVRTQNLGKTTVDELAGSMGKIIPTASSMGVNIDNLTSGYVSLTKQGIGTAEATTYMNGMLNELGDSGSTLGGVLQEKTGKSFQDLMAEGKSLGDVLQITKDYADENGIAYNELWGSAEAGKAGLAILNGGVDEFNNTVGTMKSKTDDVSLALEKLDTPSVQFKQSLNSVKNAGIEMGTSLMVSLAPVLEKVAGAIQNVAQWFGNLSSTQQNVVLGIVGFVAAIGPVTGIVSTIIGVVSTLSGAFGALAGIGGIGAIAPAVTGALSGLAPLLPGGLVVLGIGAVVALIATHWDQVKEAAGKVKDFVVGKFTALKDGVVAKFTALKTSVTNTVTNLKKGVTEKITALKTGVTDTIENLKKGVTEKWTAIKNSVGSTIDNIKSAASEKWTSIKDTVGGAIDNIKDAASDKWSSIKDTIGGAVDAIKDGASDKFSAVKDTLSGLFDGIHGDADTKMSGTQTIVTDAFDAMLKAVGFSWGLPDLSTDVIDNAVEFVSDAVDTLKDLFDFDWEFPSIKLPHFSWHWKSIGGLVDIPVISVDWYKKAYNNPYMFTSPTVMNGKGFGDGSGGEIVYGHQSLMNDIMDAMRTVLSTDYSQYSGASAGNGLLAYLEYVQQQNGNILALLSQIAGNTEETKNMQIVLDTGATVGALAPHMNSRLGVIAARQARGN